MVVVTFRILLQITLPVLKNKALFPEAATYRTNILHYKLTVNKQSNYFNNKIIGGQPQVAPTYINACTEVEGES